QNLCLENILHGFTRPCILDLKMGSLLYDHDATEEKRNRMIHHSQTTTSGTLGLRISGMKVYDSIERKYATYEKAYGK
ncbi:inositol polyphosphate kinase, partial [Gilbertella persicaria]|uniref:inositol polyphosphate kinase n=1 Tax=Gilbertella persicaria TaxID=101096 RepID=UPI00221FE7AF